MKRLIPAIVTIFGLAVVTAWAVPPATLNTLRAVHALTNAEAANDLPVAFEATVTYYRGYENTLFVQDGDVAIYVFAPTNLQLVPGDRVLVRGKTRKSFNPFVRAESIKLLRHEVMPKPESATFDEMIRANTDCKLVTVRGIVRTADPALSLMAPVRYMRLQLLMAGGYFDANVDGDDASAFDNLLDSEVELTGVASEEFDSKMQETGILIHVQSVSDIRIVSHANSDVWSLPVTPMDRAITVYHLQDSTQRVRVHGTITYYQPGSAVVLQDGAKSIWIATLTYMPLRIGDEADATGFPDNHDGFVNLVHGEVRDNLVQAPVTPLPATWEILTPRGYDSPGHHHDLVSIEGQVVTEVHEASQDEFVLAIDGKQFSAIYRHPDGPVTAPREVPLGSRVRVTGICVLEYSNPFIAQVPFNILLRSFDDIAVLQRPSLLNVRNLMLMVGLLLVIVAIVGARGWALERKVRQKTAALAVRIESEAALERNSALLEQKRSHILEDINGSKQLGTILEKITEMVSLRLDGVPCWCELADGVKLGNHPSELDGLRVASTDIVARSGPPLGELLAALASETPQGTREQEALANGARLATLAIETRRLYSDLRRRSEFDLLTDIYNRFSLHKRLDVLIEEARQSGGVFGLIYIDLDKFKPINDTYGHHVGDVYLQEVAKRMSCQLLGGDMLARLGGDEFAALVSLQHGRSDMDKIVARLKHCFAEPFVIEGHVLKGLASIGIAVYPEDGATKDSLLNAADAAMYVVKNLNKKAAAKMA